MSASKTLKVLKGYSLSIVFVCFHLVGHAPRRHRHHRNRGRPGVIVRCLLACKALVFHLMLSFPRHFRRPKKKAQEREAPLDLKHFVCEGEALRADTK